MNGYGIFSQFYDELTNNVNYKERAEYFRTLLVRHGVKDGATVLDIGCGTGQLTAELSLMGYDMIGIDPSADMLCKARENSYEKNTDILLLCQSAEKMDLFGTVDCAVSSLDVINHLDNSECVKKAFYNTGLFMNPGGIFVFDINTEYKHKEILKNNTFVYETDSVFCVWQNTLQNDNSVNITLDFFEEENGIYYRSTEEFTERAYSVQEIENWLNEAQFVIKEIFDDTSLTPVKADSQRAVIVAEYTGKRN